MSDPKTPDDSEVPDETIFVAGNVDEFVDKARYQMLFDARNEASEAIRRAPGKHLQGQQKGIDNADRAVSEDVRAAVSRYVYEAEPLYESSEAGSRKWESEEIGPFPLFDCVFGVERKDVKDFEILNAPAGLIRTSLRGRPALAFEGVEAFLEFDSAWVEVTRTVELPRRGSATKEETARFEIIPSVSHSTEVFRTTNELLSELEIGLQAETAEDGASWDADYRDQE